MTSTRLYVYSKAIFYNNVLGLRTVITILVFTILKAEIY